MNKLIIFVLIFILPFSEVSYAQSYIPDSLALVDLYNSTNGQNWKNRSGWLTSTRINQWYGIHFSASAYGFRVTSINLDNNNLVGKIPASFRNIVALDELDLSHNKLYDSIPSQLGILAQNSNALGIINLSYNQLSGSVPLTFLWPAAGLDLRFNKFTFEGIEQLVQDGRAITYDYQDIIPLHFNGRVLSVSAGGTLKNNTYTWYRAENYPYNIYSAKNIGDSTFQPPSDGKYIVTVTNKILTRLTLVSDTLSVMAPKGPPLNVIIAQPNPQTISKDGSIVYNSVLATIYPYTSVIGAATDGTTKLLLIAKTNDTATFTLKGNANGKLSSLSNQAEVNAQVIVSPFLGEAVAVYIVPDGYGIDNPLNGRDISITVNTKYNSETNIKLTLLTPPIILVHGMWGTPDTWEDHGFIKYFKTSGFNLNDIYLVNYSATSSSTFNPDNPQSINSRRAVQSKIAEAFGSYLNKRIAVTQVDVIAHSLGGLVVRSYSQADDVFKSSNYNKGSIHKFITIGTPHRGSPFGPLLWNIKDRVLLGYEGSFVKVSDLLEWQSMPIGSCLEDFGKNSSGMKALKYMDVKGYTIAGNYLGKGEIPEAMGAGALDILSRFFFLKSFNSIFESECEGYGRLNNDLIVSVNSQTNGLTQLENKLTDEGQSFSIFWGTAHSDPPAYSSLKVELSNPLIHQKVKELLLNTDLKYFSPFTTPDVNIIDCQDTKNITGTNLQTNSSQNNISNTGNKYIKITSPLNRTIFKKQDEITLQFDIFNNTIPTDAMFFVAGIGLFQVPNIYPYKVTFVVPQNSPIGKIAIAAIVRDTTGIILIDTSNLIINAPGILDSISVDPRFIKLDSNFRATNIYLRGFFKEIDSNYIENLTKGSTGTIYSVSKGESVIKVSSDGLVSAIAPGLDTLRIKNNGKTLTIPISVDNNFKNRVLYPSSIDFAPILDKFIGDAPFSLAAFTTSGEPVKFTLVDGPIELINGIVIIKAPGTATIKAFSNSNTYFSEPISITRSFVINNNILPLKIINFSGRKDNKEVNLAWETEEEKNVDYFIAQRSLDALHFDSIGKVTARGSIRKTKYELIDKSLISLQASKVYYQLIEVDKNAKISKSDIIKLEFNMNNGIKVFPNPAKKNLNISTFKILGNKAFIYVRDLEGKLIIKQKLESTLNQIISLSKLTSGTYHTVILDAGEQIFQQIITVVR